MRNKMHNIIEKLTVAIGNVELLKHKVTDKDVLERLEKIYKAIKDTDLILQDLRQQIIDNEN